MQMRYSFSAIVMVIMFFAFSIALTLCGCAQTQDFKPPPTHTIDKPDPNETTIPVNALLKKLEVMAYTGARIINIEVYCEGSNLWCFTDDGINLDPGQTHTFELSPQGKFVTKIVLRSRGMLVFTGIPSYNIPLEKIRARLEAQTHFIVIPHGMHIKQLSLEVVGKQDVKILYLQINGQGVVGVPPKIKSGNSHTIRTDAHVKTTSIKIVIQSTKGTSYLQVWARPMRLYR
ncbi:hypothetical protein KKA15_02950 [Patescibacteria group bacterium]|nr:hypothetical protein [Patescibacteria group bacterium]